MNTPLLYFFHGRKVDVANTVFRAWQLQGPRCPFWFFVPCAPDRVIRSVMALQDVIAETKSPAGVVRYKVAKGGVLVKFLHTRRPPEQPEPMRAA